MSPRARGRSRMDPRTSFVDGMHDHDGNLHAERGALIDTAARRFDGAAVHLRQLPGNRQAQAQSAALARDAGIRLTEPLEHVRQELGRDADAGIADRDFDVRVDALEPDLHFAAAVRELHGVRQQIPHHLLQPFRIPRNRRRRRIEHRLDPDAFRVGGRRDRVDGIADDVGKLDRLNVQADLAGDDAGDVEHVLDDLGQ